MRCAWLTLLFALPALAASPLQTLVDAAPAGSSVQLPPGHHAGPLVIDKPLTVDGGGRTTIDNGGHGTVLTLRTSGATVRGLVLTGSGVSHDGMDTGIQIEGDDNLVENNVVTDALFGINIRQGNRNRVLNNRVTGKDLPLGLRGDGLRLWNSRRNLVQGNVFERVRDITLANSPDNRIVGNRFHDGRYGMHLIFSPRTLAEGNRISDTGTGIVVLYSEDVVPRNNGVAHALESGGGGIVFKESGEGLAEGNEILHCSVGLLANAPMNTENALTIRANRFAYNIVGMAFYGEKGGHRITDNRFEGNLSQVVASAPGVGSANVWRGNYWSDYQGFDRDGNGIGDTPHELYIYADRIWMEIPKTKFFANSPVFELLDFLERLAPFSGPSLIVRDPTPRMK